MSGRSPKDRLSKLFKAHKTATPEGRATDTGATPSPPQSSNNGLGRRLSSRRLSARKSLIDLVHGRGSEQLKRRSQVGSDFADDVVPASTAIGAQAAADKAMYGDHEPDYTAGTAMPGGSNTQSDNDADRGLKRKPVKLGMRPKAESEHVGNGFPSSYSQPLIADGGRHSEDVADWNIVQSAAVRKSALPQPLNVRKPLSADRAADSMGSPISPVSSNESRGLSHKPDVSNLRMSSDKTRPDLHDASLPRTSSERRRIKRSSLDKPLPSQPSDEFDADLQNDRVIRTESGSKALPIGQGKRAAGLADKNIDLAGVVDLSNTEDTTLHEKWAPAVTHETVVRETREIIHEETTREIHNHHVFHRVLPIIDIEVLPARHFIPVEGGYAEIAEEEVPGQAGKNAQWLIAETVSKMLPKGSHSIVPERFTAREFKDRDGDYKEYMTSEGFMRTEQWWVHPPTFYEPGAVASGQTYPFFVGSPDPKDDGIRARLPGGNVVGLSPLLAQRRREQAGGAAPVPQKSADVPPPVPAHKIFPADLVDSARSKPAALRK